METKSLYGVGGWLKFFVISIVLWAIFLPCTVIFALYVNATHGNVADAGGSGRSLQDAFILVTWICFGLQSLIFAFLAWRLCVAFKPSTITMTLIGMWVVVLIRFFYDPVWVREVFVTLIPVILWTFYFLKSERIKNTYYDQAES